MANIAVTKENGGQPQTITHREWDPFRAMRELMRWDPFAAMPAWPAEARDVMNVAFDVKETKDGFVFTADVPGIESKDIDVKLQNNRLTISGKREQEKTDKGDTYYSYERSYGSFTRSFTLPEEIPGLSIVPVRKPSIVLWPNSSEASTPFCHSRSALSHRYRLRLSISACSPSAGGEAPPRRRGPTWPSARWMPPTPRPCRSRSPTPGTVTT